MTDEAGRLRLEDPSTGYMFDFGTVTNISEQFQKSCSVTPIVTKPKQAAFPLESRTYKTITVSFTRKQPSSPSSSSHDTARWSNADWTEALMKSLDRWQARTDGYRLSYVPASDNPYIAPLRGRDGSSSETGYIKNLSIRAVKGRPESLQGSFEFHVGSMYIRSGTPDTEGYSRKDFSITISDENGSNSVLLMRMGDGEGSDINLVDSCTITAGPEAPFEYAQITIPRKAFSRAYPSLLSEKECRLKAGRNKLIISLAGTSTMTLTKVKLSKNTLTLTAYCDAERIRGATLKSDTELSPGEWVDAILTDPTYWGRSFTSSDIVSSYRSPSPGAPKYEATENLVLKFPAGTNIWFILQVAAMICGAKVFFANDKAYVVDYRGESPFGTPPVIDLYSGEEYAGAVTGEVELDDEGTDTVMNSIRIKCSMPVVKDGRYVESDSGGISSTQKEIIVRRDGSIDIYNGEKTGGQYVLTALWQDDPSADVVYNGSEKTKDSEGSGTSEEGESGSEGQEGGSTGESEKVTDGATEYFNQAWRFGNNLLDYVEEAQQTIRFKMRELAGSGTGSWKPFFEPRAVARVIKDEVDGVRVDNMSEDGSEERCQKLALKTYERSYPECTTEYTWGVLASMDLSSNTSRIQSAQDNS